MKQIIKDILLEFYEEGIPKTLERLVTKPFLPEIVRKVWVLMGMRRTGKTWTAYQHMHEIINKGLEKEKILYLNFEDDRLAGFSLKDFQSILDAYFDLHPEFSNSSDLFFCFDEIHIIEGWEKFIRRLLDKEKMQICVTGSSAHMLSKELSTTLGGRAWAQEIFPCDFREFLAFKKVKASFNVSAKARSELRNLATEYLLYGGFPETILSSKESYVPLVQDYIHAVVFKDIVERYEVKNIHALKTFLLYCLRQLSAPLSVTKIFNTLKSQGVIVGKNALYQYLTYFEDAYVLFCVPIFTFSEKIRQANPKKIYAVDPGIITVYSVKKSYERAARLENAVFNKLRGESKDIFYYKTKSGKEVDFILMTAKGEYKLFQVCLDMQEEETKTRELSALKETAKELDLQEAIIITEDQEEEIQEEGVKITCIPFWKWALLKSLSP